ERNCGVLAQMTRRDPQRVQHAAQRGVGTQDDALDVRSNLVEQVKPMVALRIAVDDSRAEQEPLVLELLRERRLPRSECADAEDGRVAVDVGALAEVEAN